VLADVLLLIPRRYALYFVAQFSDKIFVVRSCRQKSIQKISSGGEATTAFYLFYFLGFGGLLPAGPLGRLSFVLGRGS